MRPASAVSRVARLVLSLPLLGIAPLGPGQIPRFGQIGLTEAADASILLPDRVHVEEGRYGLLVGAHVVTEDPLDPARKALQATDGTNALLTFQEGFPASSLLLEWEQYHDQEGGSECAFFELADADGQRLTLQREATQTLLVDVPGIGDVIWRQNLPLQQWTRLRLQFTARSGKAGSNDGTLIIQMDDGAGLETVVALANHDLTSIDSLGFVLTEGSTTSRTAAWRKLVWDSTDDDVWGAANPNSLWRHRGHQFGAMEPDGNGGVRMNVWVHYAVGLYGSAKKSYDANIEVDVDELFSDPLSKVVELSALDALNGTATFDGLAPLTRYYVRARLLRDDEVVAVTEPSHVTTISVPNGVAGQLHIIHGSCVNSNSVRSPHTTFHTALQLAPDNAALILSHVGDIGYIDTQLHLENAPPGPRNPNATPEMFDRLYNQTLFSDPFRELAAHAACWFMWDDHEIVNGWSGPGLGGQFAVDEQLFEVAQAAAYRWWGNRLLDDTTPTLRYSHVETARCLLIFLDVRTYNDQVNTMLGAEQIAWVKSLLSTKIKPIVFLMSPTHWATDNSGLFEHENWTGHLDERDDLIEHFLSSNPTGRLFLLSGDRHFCMHNSRDFQQFGPRIQGDWLAGAFSMALQDVNLFGWAVGQEFEADHVENFGQDVGDTVRGYLKIDVDETQLTVRIAITNGDTGEETYVVTTRIEPAGDIDGDGVVGTTDLLILLGAWGACADCGNCVADLDGDCAVGTTDLLILLGAWG